MNINVLIAAAAGFALAALIFVPMLVRARRRAAADSAPTGRHALRDTGAKRAPEGKAPAAGTAESKAAETTAAETKAAETGTGEDKTAAAEQAGKGTAPAASASATKVSAAPDGAVPEQQAAPESAEPSGTASETPAAPKDPEMTAVASGAAESGATGERPAGQPASDGEQPPGVSVPAMPSALFEKNYQAKFRRTQDRIHRLRDKLNEDDN